MHTIQMLIGKDHTVQSNDDRGYKSYRVSGLPVGPFGETYVITTATLGDSEVHRFELFILSKRHEPHLHFEAFQFHPNDVPEELLKIDEDYLYSEARQQAQIYLDDALCRLAEEHGDQLLDRYRVELIEVRHMPLLSLWMRGELHKEIKEISEKTQNPRLRLSLRLTMQTRIMWRE